MDLQYFYVAISKVVPKFDRESNLYVNVDASSNRTIFRKI